jgi:hypothetical protein
VSIRFDSIRKHANGRTQVHEEEKEIQKKDRKDITEKKKRKYFGLSDYRYISYVGLKEAVNHLTPEDTYLAYLPLAHILEYVVELIMLFVGMPTGFGGVKVCASCFYGTPSSSR